MTLKLYLAGAWGRKHEIADYKRQLDEAGFDVLSTWTDEPDGEHSVNGAYSPELLRQIADRDLDELSRADVLLLVGNEPATATVGGGRHAEMGFALCRQIPIILFGPPEHIFWYTTANITILPPANSTVVDSAIALMRSWERTR